jgi:thymidine kinase
MRERGKFLCFFVSKSMASGKTSHLLLEIETRRKYGNKHIIVVKPSTDTRSGEGRIKSWKGEEGAAFEIPARNPWELLNILRKQEKASGMRPHVIAFDEVQFFPRERKLGFFQLVQYLLDEGYDILAAGLSLDFRGEPFGSTPDLVILAEDRCMWLKSYCTICGEEAEFSQRLINGAPAAYNSPQILVGGRETYQPRCAKHFVIPQRSWYKHFRESKR